MRFWIELDRVLKRCKVFVLEPPDAEPETWMPETDGRIHVSEGWVNLGSEWHLRSLRKYADHWALDGKLTTHLLEVVKSKVELWQPDAEVSCMMCEQSRAGIVMVHPSRLFVMWNEFCAKKDLTLC